MNVKNSYYLLLQNLLTNIYVNPKQIKQIAKDKFTLLDLSCKVMHFTFYCIHRRHPVILWFSVRYAAAAVRREIFGINSLRGKLQQLGSPNLQDIFIGW